jgi:site-specific DNA-cytosine methylase
MNYKSNTINPFVNMNVLSLFDGMSCGQIALNKLNIKYDNYFAAEIKKHAIQCTLDNYPHTQQIGDVTKIRGGNYLRLLCLLGVHLVRILVVPIQSGMDYKA